MKSMVRFTTLLLCIALLGGIVCAKDKDASALKTDKDKLSYALGVNTANQLREQSVEVDLDLFCLGFRHALEAKPNMLMSGEQIGKIVMAMQQEVQQKMMEMRKQAEQRLAEQNKKEGEAFLAQNATMEGVVTLDSGLQYKILKAGNGPKPTLNDTVVCHYRGTLVDGSEFDSSYARNQPSTFPVNRVVKGWIEALQRMPVGSRWKLFIPSDLAYGQRGTGRTIGPNAALIFEVELLSIEPPQDTKAAQDKKEASRTAAVKQNPKAADM